MLKRSALLLAFLLLPQPLNSSAATAGLKLRQRAPNNNIFRVFVTPTAIRVDNLTNHYHIVSKAPDFHVSIWQDDRRELAEVSHQKWCQQMQLRMISWTSELRKPNKSESCLYQGRPAVKYTFGATHMVGSLFFKSGLGAQSRDNKDIPNYAEMTCIKFPGSEMTGPVVSRLQNLPAVPGIPVLAQRVISDGRVNGAIHTARIEEAADMPPSLFAVPTDYKLVPFAPKLLLCNFEVEKTKGLLEFMK